MQHTLPIKTHWYKNCIDSMNVEERKSSNGDQQNIEYLHMTNIEDLSSILHTRTMAWNKWVQTHDRVSNNAGHQTLLKKIWASIWMIEYSTLNSTVNK